MNNYNFFEPYIKKPEKINYERVFWLTAIGMSLLVIALLFFSNMMKLKTLDDEIASLDARIGSSELQKKIQEVAEIENTMLQMEASAKKLQLLDLATAATQSFTYDTFRDLNTRVPKNVFISDINYNNRSLAMAGFGERVEDIALFQHQLSNQATFSGVRVSDVIAENENYSFNMSAATTNAYLAPYMQNIETVPETVESEEGGQDAESEGE